MPPENRQSTACTDLTWLGPAEKELQFGRKDELWAQGSIAASVAQVTSGVVKLVRNWESGRRTLVGLASAGTIIGLEQVLNQRPQPFLCEALTRGRINLWSRTQLRTILTQDPSCSIHLFEALHESNTALLNSLRAHSDGPVAERTARALLNLCKEHGFRDARGVLLPLRLSRTELADMIGCRVETLVRLIGSWKSQGIVSSPRGVTLLIQDEKALQEVAEMGLDDDLTYAASLANLNS